jgi:mRNA-degrading endonuclease RelE of RelBE toxin-antitoxin system
VSNNVYFSSEFYKELERLFDEAPDLPIEVAKLIPLLEAQLHSNSVIVVRRSKSGKWIHYKCRARSKSKAVGKREGFRIHVVVGPTEIRFVCVYIAHEDKDDISGKENKAIAAAMEDEAAKALSKKWYSVDDFKRKFSASSS